MPKVTFSTENKKTSPFDYPKLSLRKGEAARLIMIEKDPSVEYVHNLRTPVVAEGVPVYITEKKKNGDEYQTNKMDFLSSPICLGDFDTLEEAGSDAARCPLCALAKEGLTDPPKRRFATNVIRYSTKPNSFDIQEPFAVSHTVWRFTDMLFNKIADYAEQWKNYGGLLQHDLLLGPCTNQDFQKAELAVAPEAEWIKSDERKRLVAQSYKENKIDDLTVAIGSVLPERRLTEDIEAVRSAWARVANAQKRASGGSPASFNEGIDKLLDTPAVSAAPAAPVESVEDLFGTATDAEGWAQEVDETLVGTAPESFQQPAAEAAPAAAPAQTATAVAVETAQEIPVASIPVTPIPAATPTDDLDDLLKGL